MTRYRVISLTAAEADAFSALVDKRSPDQCWPWTGRKGAYGYGLFRGFIASRIAWLLAHGQQPAGMVCHSCDNPPCCNPGHLWIGTDHDNHVDMARKGRARGQQTTRCVNGHPYTPQNTYWRPGKIASRDCRICIRIRVARYRKEKAA